jgi:hypothetical protein
MQSKPTRTSNIELIQYRRELFLVSDHLVEDKSRMKTRPSSVVSLLFKNDCVGSMGTSVPAKMLAFV